MKILLLTNKDLASQLALNLLLPELSLHQVMIGMSDKVGGDQPRPQVLIDLSKHELNLMNKPFIFSGLEIKPFKELVRKYDREIKSFNDINQPDGITKVKAYAPDLILSIRFGKILQQPIIDIPKLGVINLHSGLLPAYQGVMATFWTMLNGEQNIGSCLHYISDKKIDSGEIIQQATIPINTKKSYLENVLEIYFSGCQMMTDAVEKISQDIKLSSAPQVGEGSYYGFPNEADLANFFDKGFRLFDPMPSSELVFFHRLAQQEDISNIIVLMQKSIEVNMKPFLSKEEIEAAKETMGVDQTLIQDQTYFVIEAEISGKKIMVGCGGWGKRKTLYGGDHTIGRDDSFSDPETDPARIRAMYTHPDWIRKGIGKLLMKLGEDAAREAGFKAIELGATTAGEPLYLAQGYKEVERETSISANGAENVVIRMLKDL